MVIVFSDSRELPVPFLPLKLATKARRQEGLNKNTFVPLCLSGKYFIVLGRRRAIVRGCHEIIPNAEQAVPVHYGASLAYVYVGGWHPPARPLEFHCLFPSPPGGAVILPVSNSQIFRRFAVFSGCMN